MHLEVMFFSFSEIPIPALDVDGRIAGSEIPLPAQDVAVDEEDAPSLVCQRNEDLENLPGKLQFLYRIKRKK